MERQDLHAARLKHRWVAPPLQQVVQHLVLGESTIVHQALRHIDRVRRAPPTVAPALVGGTGVRSEEHTSELQSHSELVCRLLLEKKNHGGIFKKSSTALYHQNYLRS